MNMVFITAAAIVINIFITGLVFKLSEPVNRFLRKADSKTISKITSLRLAAIDVMIVRKGISLFIT